jgi:hypothetical protein
MIEAGSLLGASVRGVQRQIAASFSAERYCAVATCTTTSALRLHLPIPERMSSDAELLITG